MKIALDVMGGDFAPDHNLEGLASAVADFPQVERFLLVGRPEVIGPALGKVGLSPDHERLEVVPATQIVEMRDKATVAVRQKKDSSITVAASLVAQDRADAFVSAGHTGASVTAAVVRNRLLPGIDRPGIACPMPGPHGPCTLLDCGATVDCKPLNLAQYAILGEAYCREILKIREPRIGILNVGEEEEKGDELTRGAHRMLQRLPINFVGSVEGRDIFQNVADLIVCDGFVGNSVLKTAEGLAKVMVEMLSTSLRKNSLRMAGALLSKPAFQEIRELTDYATYGGSPLLGVNGICIIAHGSSSPKAIRNALRVAAEMVERKVNRQVSEKLQQVDWPSLSASANSA